MQRLNRKEVELKAIKLELPKFIYNEIAHIAETEDKSVTYSIVEALQTFITSKEKNL